MIRKIAFFTSTRAEYGLLRPLMAEVASRRTLSLQVIVSGTHLSREHGNTWREIVADGFCIDARVKISLAANQAKDVAFAAADVLKGVANTLTSLKPDVLILLGDRFELLAAAQASLLCKIPIVHIHGGESTEGAFDDSIRNAITKLAYWHFAAADAYVTRILQMGESANRVWNVGAMVMDNLAALSPASKDELEGYLGIKLKSPVLLVTYHPVTLQDDNGFLAMEALLAALKSLDCTIIITGTNADPGSASIRKSLQEFVITRSQRCVLVQSLGARLYLSLMHFTDVVVGNSSSGILEAPAVGVPSVDIGARQLGRLKAPSVIHCGESCSQIRRAIEYALSVEHRTLAKRKETPYGQPGASRSIADLLEVADLTLKNKPFIERKFKV